MVGVDVARYGDDRTVIVVRRGHAIVEKRVYRELNTMEVASRVVEVIEQHEPQAVFVDIVGIGAGVVDRLHQLGHRRKVIGVSAAEKAMDVSRYANKRAEMWAKTKEWLREWGALEPQDITLAEELMGPEYGYDARERIQLERKKDMKKRGLASPDEADALALTFAMPVASRQDKAPEDIEPWLLDEAGLGWMR